MARLLVFNVKQKKFYEAECNELKDYYKHLECNCFDIANRRIGGEVFSIYLDDEGLFKKKIEVSAINRSLDERTILVGNLIFSRTDINGETISLTDKDIELIKSRYNYKLNIILMD